VKISAAAAETVTCYQRTFHGRPDQVSVVRADIARHLAGSPVTNDAVLIASELAANAIVHSASSGEFFTVRCERHPGYVRVEAEDLGGPWQHKPPSDRPHGLDIISALAGPDNWGTETTSDGDRVVWARLDLPQDERTTT
jgi:two-component sensor histidine kinase